MKAKENKKGNMVTIPESRYLALVGASLKGRVLFPKKLAGAKDILKRMTPLSEG